MTDVFIEHMVARRPDTKTRLIKSGILLAVVLVCAAVLVALANIPWIGLFGPLLIVGAIWGGLQLSRRQNIEYEYILTNGELDVDKIFNRSTRKRQLSIDCRVFEVLAPYKQAYLGEYESVTNRLDASSGLDTPARCFAVFPGKDGGRQMLIFEPNERMASAFRQYIPRKIKQ